MGTARDEYSSSAYDELAAEHYVSDGDDENQRWVCACGCEEVHGSYGPNDPGWRPPASIAPRP